jgi:hypothetical protein
VVTHVAAPLEKCISVLRRRVAPAVEAGIADAVTGHGQQVVARLSAASKASRGRVADRLSHQSNQDLPQDGREP